jgi:hypothetical protein
MGEWKLTSALDKGGQSASHLYSFTIRERVLGMEFKTKEQTYGQTLAN